MVNTPPLKDPNIPAGSVPAVIEAPVPPPAIAYVILVSALFIQRVCEADPDDKLMVELVFTIKDALPEKAVGQAPSASLITTLYLVVAVVASVVVTFERVKVSVVDPEILPPSVKFVLPFLHWYVKFVPVATTENVAVFVSHTVWVAMGWASILISWFIISVISPEVAGVQGEIPLTTT